jgi:putative transposase
LATAGAERAGASGRRTDGEDAVERRRQRSTYGARRVWRDLLAEGVSCGLHKVERLMRANALRARPRRRGLPKDSGQTTSTPAANVLDRKFSAERPNQKWIADFT